MAFLALSLLAAAADNKPAPNTNGKTKVSGFLVDVSCAEANAKKGAEWGAKHGKSCLTMEDCQSSGFAVLTPDNKVIKFDAEGNKQATTLIKNTNKDKDWRVTVTGNLAGNTIAVSSMELQ
jgi:hypothetical protein